MRTLPEKYLSHRSLDKNVWEVDLEVLDRYQTFSAELLRLALLGLAGYGFLVANIVVKVQGPTGDYPLLASLPVSRYALIAGAIALLLSALFALNHRYMSTDAVAHHVRRLRLRDELSELSDGAEGRAELEALLTNESSSLSKDNLRCQKALWRSAATLILGVGCVAISYIITIFHV